MRLSDSSLRLALLVLIVTGLAFASYAWAGPGAPPVGTSPECQEVGRPAPSSATIEPVVDAQGRPRALQSCVDPVPFTV